MAVLVPYREFQRDLTIYGDKAGWIRHAIESFAKMPPLHGADPVASSRLIAVLQGWDVNADEIEQQIQVAEQCSLSGYIIAHEKIEQGWQPKVVRWRK